MTSQGALMFALFASRERAGAAQAELEAAERAEVESIVSPGQLRRRASSTGVVVRGLGMLLGVSLIVGFVVVGLGLLLLTAAGALPEPVPTSLLAAAVAVVLAATLGGLAGWLAFTSHTRLELDRLCMLVERGHGLLVFPARDDVGAQLRERGAVRIGSLT